MRHRDNSPISELGADQLTDKRFGGAVEARMQSVVSLHNLRTRGSLTCLWPHPEVERGSFAAWRERGRTAAVALHSTNPC